MSDNKSDKVFKGMRSQSIVTILLGVVSLVYFSIMSRRLGQEEFGYLAIITAVTTILSEISNAGLGSAVIQHKDITHGYVQTAFTLSVSVGMFFMVFLFLCAGWLSSLLVQNDVLVTPFRIMSLTLLGYNINSVLRATYMRQLQFMRYGLQELMALTLSSIIGVVMAYAGFGIYSIVAASVTNVLLLSLILLWLCRSNVSLGIKRQHIRSIVNYGGWLTGSGIVRCIYDQLDKLITTSYLSVASLGAYNRPSGLIFQISVRLFGIFDTILFPILSSIQDDKSKLKEAYIKSMNLVVSFSSIIAFLMILSSPVLVAIFLGSEWNSLLSLLQLLVLSIIFMAYGRIGDCFFRSIGIVKSYFYVRVIVCIISVVCIVIGCQFNIMGLAIAVLGTRLIDCLVKTFFLARHINFGYTNLALSILKGIFAPTLLCIGGYLILLQSPTIIMSIIITTAYALILLISIILRPSLLGEHFEQNVYFKIHEKLSKKIRTDETFGYYQNKRK